MKIDTYFKVIKPTYVYLKLTPTFSTRNQSTDQIAKAITTLYKSLGQIIYRFEKQIFYNPPTKIAYYIYIEKQKAEFYFIVPEAYLQLIEEKIKNTWKSITVDKVDSIPLFTDKATMYYLTYKKEDGLSLQVDKRSNTLLSSLLNVIPVLKEGDRVGIFYNFIPRSQIGWKAQYNKTMQKIKDGVPIDKNFGVVSGLKMLVFVLIYVLDIIQNAVFSITKTENQKETFTDLFFKQLNSKALSTETIRKGENTVLQSQLLIISQSNDKLRESNNARAVCTAFQHISEDNELIYKRVKKSVSLMNVRISNVPINTVSVDECQNFIALPGRELLEEHGCITRIDTLESEVPPELQEGVMCVGNNTYKGKVQKAYLTEDKEFKNLTLVLIGPTRAGKTTLISNLSKDGIEHKETTIIFDYCGNCELSQEVAEAIGTNNVLTIDCSNSKTMQGLGYNEVTPKDNDVFEVYRCAKTKTSQLMTLINSVANEELRDRMERYLEAAAVIVFIQDGPIRDVFAVLQNHKTREEYIDNVPENQREYLEEYILDLKELDEWSRGTKDNPAEVIGTKTSYVQGILNRVSKLKQNSYMELMLKKDCSNNINLVNEMQKAQLICIKMPEVMFSTEQEKDIYATYWLTKIWGALQKRKWDIPEGRTKVNIVIDELYQVPSCQEFLRSKLSQIAKFTAKPIISCHYLGQIGIIRDELKAANSSYMLIAGCDKDNFKELKSELYPYTEEDLLNLKRFESLNLLKYQGGYAKFITKLPTPLK